MTIRKSLSIFGTILAVGSIWAPCKLAQAQDSSVTPGLVLPSMDAQNGKKLFASKGCVLCHKVNGVGGTDGGPLDASAMPPVMSPFDFFANMWDGAEPMIIMQKREAGGKIDFTGQELADIIAFVHNPAMQRTFSERDIPDNIKALMGKDDNTGEGTEMKMHRDSGG